MATLETKILEAAFEDGLIAGSLSKNQQIYLLESVISANVILIAIRQSDGLDVEQLAKRTDFHPNTVKVYCRWLKSKKLIQFEEEGKGGKVIYHSI